MAEDMHLRIIEEAIGYHFVDQDLLRLSLTAAGAEEDNHEGNRRLASVGDAAIPLVVAVGGFEKMAAPSQNHLPTRRRLANVACSDRVNDIKSFLSDKSHRARAAERLNIASCIKLCPRSRGHATKTILSLALSAIIGAAYKDSDDLGVVARIVERLKYWSTLVMVVCVCVLMMVSLLCTNEVVVDPLSLRKATDVPVDSANACEKLIDDQWIRPPPMPKLKEKAGARTTLATDIVMTGLENADEIAVSRSSYQWLDDENTLTMMPNTDACTVSNNVAIEAHSEMDLPRYDMVNLTSINDSDPVSAQNMFGADIPESMSLFAGQMLFPENDSIDYAHQEGERRGAAVATSTHQPTLPVVRRNGRRTGAQAGSRPLSALNSYIEMERGRCRDHDHTDPRSTYLPDTIMEDLGGHEAHDRGCILLTLYLVVCSPEAVATLRESIVSIRANHSERVPSPTDKMTIRERYTVIEDIGRRKSYLTLIERLHILQMYEDHSGAVPGQGDWILLQEPHQGRRGRAGNPRHSAKADTTKALLKEIFPQLEPNSNDYKPKYEKVKRTQKLGERLSSLKAHFGQGIIGLMQCNDYGTTMGIAMSISNQTLLEPSDVDFKKLVLFLQKSQGEELRRWSQAIAPLLDHVSRGTLPDVPAFSLERVTQDNILRLPKYSEQLLRLISS